MKKNKLLKNLLILSAGCLLASCDPVKALPKNYNESIVVNNDGSELDISDNDLLQIYNLVEEGKNEKVVSQILEKIAENKFGTFKDFIEVNEGKKSLSDFVSGDEETKEVREKFFGEDAETQERRFKDFTEDVTSRISESFYNEITSGSYNDEDGKFSEEKLYNAKRYDLFDLHKLDKTNAADKLVIDNKFYVDNTLTKENAIDRLQGTYYNLEEGAHGYIEEKVYPDILKNKLVEDYIYTENPASLGRAYARKVNYVKVSFDDNTYANLWSLMKVFSDNYIKTDAKMDFEHIVNAIKGFSVFNTKPSKTVPLINNIIKDGGDAKTLLSDEKVLGAPVIDSSPLVDGSGNAIQFDENIMYGENILLVPGVGTGDPATDGIYYKDTKLGEILVSYKKALKAEELGRFAPSTLTAELEKFTGEGKTKEYGLMQKLISLAKEDFTTDGWYLKNGGITELPSALRDRLFNIRVANDLENVEAESPYGTYDSKHYFRNINGKKLVLPTNASNSDYNYVCADMDGKAFYILEVLEAPSTAKLNKDSAAAYKDGDKVDEVKIEQISRQVAKILGTKDSYIKDAYTEFLNNYEFTFYDQSLFDYLKSEYPDLDQFND